MLVLTERCVVLTESSVVFLESSVVFTESSVILTENNVVLTESLMRGHKSSPSPLHRRLSARTKAGPRRMLDAFPKTLEI